MKLLFDENLSPNLVQLLEDLFPNSLHVRDVGLKAAADPRVWEYAKDNRLILVSKDADMHQRSFLLVLLPKSHGYAWGIAQLQTLKDSCGKTFLPLRFSSMILTRHF